MGSSYILRALIATSTAFLTHSAVGQSFNVDLQSGLSSRPVPSSTYGAAAGQAGDWTVAGPRLKDVTGQTTDVSITGMLGITSAGGTTVYDSPDTAALMNDSVGGSGLSGDRTKYLQCIGLVPGQYSIYVYAWDAPNQQERSTYLFNQPGVPEVQYDQVYRSTQWPGFVEGESYFRRDITITETSDRFTVYMLGFGFAETNIFSSIAGFQIVQIPGPGAGMLMGAAGLGLAGLGRRRR